jgi:hypothetical protein
LIKAQLNAVYFYRSFLSGTIQLTNSRDAGKIVLNYVMLHENYSRMLNTKYLQIPKLLNNNIDKDIQMVMPFPPTIKNI